MQPLASVEAIENAGLAGDRYTGTKLAPGKAQRDPTRQVTFIESENIEHFTAQTGHFLATSDPRRNIVTTGIRLNELCGRLFQIGTARFEALELCEPCVLLKRRTHPEIMRVLRNRGGLRARIVRGGVLSVGDALVVQPTGLRDQAAFVFA